MSLGELPPRNEDLPASWFVVPPDEAGYAGLGIAIGGLADPSVATDGANDGDWFEHEVSGADLDEAPPTRWAAASTEAPAAVERLLSLYLSSVEDFGGTVEIIRGNVRLEVSEDGRPRELRFWNAAGEWNCALLWSDFNVDLWVEWLALQEAQHQRRPVGASEAEADNDTDDEADFVDPDDFAYAPLSELHPEFARAAINRYARLFLRFSRFSPERFNEARESVAVDITVNAPSPIVRCTSHFTGETQWIYDWNGSEESMIALLEDQAYEHGDWADRERVLNGPTPWDVS